MVDVVTRRHIPQVEGAGRPRPHVQHGDVVGPSVVAPPVHEDRDGAAVGGDIHRLRPAVEVGVGQHGAGRRVVDDGLGVGDGVLADVGEHPPVAAQADEVGAVGHCRRRVEVRQVQETGESGGGDAARCPRHRVHDRPQ